MQNARLMYARDHGPVLLTGELWMTFRVQRYAVLSESWMRNLHVQFDVGGVETE